MSKFSKFLRLIPSAWQNKEAVLEGAINAVKLKYDMLPEDEQEEIIRRRIICESCPFFSLNAAKDDTEYKKLFNKPFEKEEDGKYCGICGCSEDVRTSSLSSECGLKVYNEANPDNIQELKWGKYEK